MSFIDFSAFALLSLIPVIILFYLLKLKRTPVIVSSTFLWIKAIKDSKANTPFQKLRRNILLILQLLALLLFILVKSRPFFKTSFQENAHMVLIMDNSASMQSIDTGKNRFSEAQKTAINLIEQIKDKDQVMIISAGNRSRIETTFTQNKKILNNTIKSIKPVDTGTDVRDAMVLAIASLRGYPDGKIFLLSDGRFKMENLGPEIPPISFISFGNSSDNTGIININLRKNQFSPELEALVEMKNFHNEGKNFSLELYKDNQLIDAHKINLAAGERKCEIFQNISGEPGIITVKIDIKDMLAIDNTVYGVISPVSPMKILLVTEGNVFLEHLLSLTPDIVYNKINFPSYSHDIKTDLTIFDGGSISKKGKGNYIFIGTNTKNVTITDEIKNPLITSWDKSHPLMRFLDLSDIHIAKSFKIKPPDNGKILAESQGNPIICSLIEDNFKGLFLGFSLSNSDIVLKPAFPILFQNTIEWFNPEIFQISSNRIKTGEPIKIKSDNKNIKIITPENKTFTLNREENKDLIFSDTFQCGIYAIIKEKEKTYIASNLIDEEESDIKPVKSFSTGSKNIEASEAKKIGQREIWKYIAIMIIIVLLGEWYLFHRKVT